MNGEWVLVEATAGGQRGGAADGRHGAGIGCADSNAGADADRNARAHRSAGIERDGSAGHAYARAAGDGASPRSRRRRR